MTSLLFERHAIWVLLAILLAAVWYRFIPLIVVSTFLLVLSLMINTWKKLSLRHIKTALKLSKSRLFVDEEFLITASIHNNKWLPLVWLEWIFPESKGISLGDNESNNMYTVRLLWLLWYQKAEWTLNGKALKRGVYDIGQVTLRSGDGFRFAETEKLFPLNDRIYVYPKLISVNVPNFPPSLEWGAKGKKGGFIEDPLFVIGTREYQAGDELRRFNWRASARTGKLQTNVYQPVVTEQLLIYIDVAGFVINEYEYQDPIKQKEYADGKEEGFEWFLSVIASVAVHYRERGISIGSANNGLNIDGKKMASILPGPNLTPFLDQLALITQRVGVQKMAALDEILYQGSLHVPLFVFCNYITEYHYLWYQRHRHKLSEVCFYYKYETKQISQDLNRAGAATKPMDLFFSLSTSA
ncbi:MAG: DUF58 domain-containing protein [Dehalobacterium sp.]